MHREYSRGIRSAFGGYWATWLPNVPIELGSVGTLEDDVFIPRSHLRSFGISFEVHRGQSRDHLEYTSSNGVSIRFKTQGEVDGAFEHIANGEAGALIEFTRANAFVFSLIGCREDRVADQHGLAQHLLSLVSTNWPDGYAIVTHLVRAESGTILIASSSQSRVEIAAQMKLGGLAELARVDAGLSIAFMRDMATQFVAAKGMTPLFRLARLKRSLFRPNRIESLGPISMDDVLELVDPRPESEELDSNG